MAKGEPLSAYQRKIVQRYYEHRETISLAKLGELVSEMWLCEDPKRLAAMWDRAGRALAGLGVAPERLGRLMESRDTESLVRLIGELDRGGGQAASGSPATAGARAAPGPKAVQTPPVVPSTPAGSAGRSDSAGGAPPSPPDGEQLKAAMRAFKKRLKLKRLDDESGLSRSPLSSGRPSGVLAIQPPAQFPVAVWEELVRQGRLVKEGRGLYRMP